MPKNKDKSIKFNLEKELDFYTERLSTGIALSDIKKGNQLKNYLSFSVLFNPEDVNYSKEELEEKLSQIRKLDEMISSLL